MPATNTLTKPKTKTMKNYYANSFGKRKFVPMDTVWSAVGRYLSDAASYMRNSTPTELRDAAVAIRAAANYFAAHPQRWTQGTYCGSNQTMCAVGLLNPKTRDVTCVVEDFTPPTTPGGYEGIIISVNDTMGMTPKRFPKVADAVAEWFLSIAQAMEEGDLYGTVALEANIKADFGRLANKAAWKRTHTPKGTK